MEEYDKAAPTAQTCQEFAAEAHREAVRSQARGLLRFARDFQRDAQFFAAMARAMLFELIGADPEESL